MISYECIDKFMLTETYFNEKQNEVDSLLSEITMEINENVVETVFTKIKELFSKFIELINRIVNSIKNVAKNKSDSNEQISDNKMYNIYEFNINYLTSIPLNIYGFSISLDSIVDYFSDMCSSVIFLINTTDDKNNKKDDAIDSNMDDFEKHLDDFNSNIEDIFKRKFNITYTSDMTKDNLKDEMFNHCGLNHLVKRVPTNNDITNAQYYVKHIDNDYIDKTRTASNKLIETCSNVVDKLKTSNENATRSEDKQVILKLSSGLKQVVSIYTKYITMLISINTSIQTKILAEPFYKITFDNAK